LLFVGWDEMALVEKLLFQVMVTIIRFRLRRTPRKLHSIVTHEESMWEKCAFCLMLIMDHIFQKLNIKGPSWIYEIVENTFQIKFFCCHELPCMQYHCKLQNNWHICMLYKLLTFCSQSWGEVSVISKDVRPMERIVFWVMAEHTERPVSLGITDESSCCWYTLCQVLVIVNYALLHINYMNRLRQHKNASWANCVGWI
jgi:hypothetical protein